MQKILVCVSYRTQHSILFKYCCSRSKNWIASTLEKQRPLDAKQLTALFQLFPHSQIDGTKVSQMDGTKVVADEGYSQMTCITRTSFRNNSVQLREYRKIRARNENVTRLFNRFYVFSHKFRHSLHVLQKCFFAVSSVEALELNHFTSRVH